MTSSSSVMSSGASSRTASGRTPRRSGSRSCRSPTSLTETGEIDAGPGRVPSRRPARQHARRDGRLRVAVELKLELELVVQQLFELGTRRAAAAAPRAIMQTTSTQLVATVDLDASKQSEAKVGEKVTVEMPAATR